MRRKVKMVGKDQYVKIEIVVDITSNGRLTRDEVNSIRSSAADKIMHVIATLPYTGIYVSEVREKR